MVLKSKIIMVLTVVLLLTIGTSAAIVLRVQTKMMLNSKLKDVEVLVDLIEKSITEAMEDGRTEDVQTTLEHMGQNQDIKSLRILSTGGSILKSKTPEEIGGKAKGRKKRGRERKGVRTEWHFQLFLVRARRTADAARSGLLFFGRFS